MSAADTRSKVTTQFWTERGITDRGRGRRLFVESGSQHSDRLRTDSVESRKVIESSLLDVIQVPYPRLVEGPPGRCTDVRQPALSVHACTIRSTPTARG